MKSTALLMIIWVSSFFQIEEDPLAAVLRKLNAHSKKYPIEKVHLHLDKPYYAVGDDIWLKAYVTSSQTSALSSLSKILYVELIDENDSLKTQLKLQLQNGIGWSDIKLPRTLSEGNYRIRAYTQWMRNAGPQFFFDKTIKIGSSGSPTKKNAKALTNAVDLQFFPEGGNLIQELPNIIAFKAIDSKGMGKELKGIIIDNEGTEITPFETTHLGMGSFSINPMLGKTYTAKVDGKSFNLPAAQSSGYVLNINNSDTAKVTVRVRISEDLMGKGDLQLLAQQYGKIFFSVKIPTSKNFATLNLPKKDFPSGISTFTLFNSAELPVAERLIFVNNSFDKINIAVGNLKDSYGIRDQINLELTATADSLPTHASFSAAITNTSTVAPDIENETHIFTSLLLKSELRGYIEKPNYYFMADDSQTRNDLDHLLLTQGWRKIDWNAVKATSFPTSPFKHEEGLQIKGTVFTNSRKPVANAKVSLFTSSMGILSLDTVTDINGKFSFDDLQFPDSVTFVLNATTEKGKKDVIVKLDPTIKTPIHTNPNLGDMEVNISENLKEYVKASNDYFEEQRKDKAIQLNKVDILGEKKKIVSSSNLNGGGRADYVFTEKDLEYATALSSFLAPRIGGMIASNKAAGFSGSPTVIIDGVYREDISLTDFTSIDFLLNPQTLASIEVLKSPGNTSIYGIRGAAGVVIFTTKRGADAPPTNNNLPNVLTFAPKGFAIARQFYSPRYDTPSDTKPDLRTTVYWNPAMVSNEEGKFKLDYFNPDKPGLYRVVIEGIDVMGNIGRKTFTYTVK